MTKREVLIAICEQPGWEPPDINGIERFLDELRAEGWITPRLDGWTGTARAMDEYPYFLDQDDIAEQPPPPPEVVETHYVARDRVVMLLVGMLREMPVSRVFAIATASTEYLPNTQEWEIAEHIVEEMTRARVPS